MEKDDEARARFERAWGAPIKPKYGWHMTEMLEAIGRGELTTLYVLGENPAQSDADSGHVRELLGSLDHLVVQDIFLTATAEMADVVLPGVGALVRVGRDGHQLRAPGAARAEGARAAGQARDDLRDHARPGPPARDTTGATPAPEEVWNELRSLAPNHAGHELCAAGGARRHPVAVLGRAARRARRSCTAGSGRTRYEREPVPFHVVEDDPPVDELTDEFPLLLTTGRRLDSFNTGVQTGGYTSPLRRPRGARAVGGRRRAAGIERWAAGS